MGEAKGIGIATEGRDEHHSDNYIPTSTKINVISNTTLSTRFCGQSLHYRTTLDQGRTTVDQDRIA